jgi:two-component system, cell cycle response regulator CpdR
MGQSKPFRQTAVVVEDDEIQRDMIALLLEESEFEVIQCEDAETASLAIKMRHPSFLITDVKLSGKMDGIQLAHFARQQQPKMRVVVISGHPQARYRKASGFCRSRSIQSPCCEKRHAN